MLEQRHRHLCRCGDCVRCVERTTSSFVPFCRTFSAPLIVQTAFTIANAVLLEAGLSFLGLGIQPPNPSLGLMLQEARGYIRTDAWFGICPGVLLILIVLALNAAADTWADWSIRAVRPGVSRAAL